MAGGKTTQNTSYSSGVNFAPVVSGYGSVHSGNIQTGASNGNISGSAGGAGVSLSVPMPALQNLGFSICEHMSGSCTQFQNLFTLKQAVGVGKGLAKKALFQNLGFSIGDNVSGNGNHFLNLNEYGTIQPGSPYYLTACGLNPAIEGCPNW